MGCPIDKFIARNLHLLPQETVQANFSANLLNVHSWGPTKEEISSLFAHLEPINKEDEVLSSLRGTENPEEAELNRYIEVLQARKNEMALGKEKTGPSKASPIQSGVTEWHNLQLKKHTRLPRSRFPLLNPSKHFCTRCSCPHSTVQICDTDQVEHKCISHHKLGSIWESLTFGQRNTGLSPWGQEALQGNHNSKEATSSSLRSTNHGSSHGIQLTHWMSNQEHHLAELTLPLWMIEVTLDCTIHGYRNHRQQLPGHDYP